MCTKNRVLVVAEAFLRMRYAYTPYTYKCTWYVGWLFFLFLWPCLLFLQTMERFQSSMYWKCWCTWWLLVSKAALSIGFQEVHFIYMNMYMYTYFHVYCRDSLWVCSSNTKLYTGLPEGGKRKLLSLTCSPFMWAQNNNVYSKGRRLFNLAMVICLSLCCIWKTSYHNM